MQSFHSFSITVHYEDNTANNNNNNNNQAPRLTSATFTKRFAAQTEEDYKSWYEKYAAAQVPNYARKSSTEAVRFDKYKDWESYKSRLAHYLSKQENASEDLKNHPFPDPALVQSYLKTISLIFKYKAEQLIETADLQEKIQNSDLAAAFYYYILQLNLSSNKDPAGLLSANLKEAKQAEQLLHVRMCEDAACSLNPNASKFLKFVNENIATQVLDQLPKVHLNKAQTLLYGGFASGLLLRDLMILKKIIEAGYTNLQLFLVDKSYADWIRQLAVTDDEPALKDFVEISLVNKAFEEFASWLTVNTNSTESHPLKIHVFSDVRHLTQYLEQTSQKLTLVVGQDYFTQKGCANPEHATPSAHADFMQLVYNGMGLGGVFFELIKDDNANKIYFHVGMNINNGRYSPIFTNVCVSKKGQQPAAMKVYYKTSLSFFSPCNDNPTNCFRGSSWVVYNEDRELVDGVGSLYEFLRNKRR